MRISEMKAKCETAEAFAKEHPGLVEATFTVQLPREVKGKRARVMPGVMSVMVYMYGPPAIVVVRAKDVRRSSRGQKQVNLGRYQRIYCETCD